MGFQGIDSAWDGPINKIHESLAGMAMGRVPEDDPRNPDSLDDWEPEQKGDPVNHPGHYNQFPVEVIEVTEHLNFCLGNAVKYILRCDFKGEPIQDLEKARWYIDREIQRRKQQ